MADKPMRQRPERYEDTDNPHYPPRVTGSAPALVAGLWYVLAPIGLVLLVLLLYWIGRGPEVDDAVEPTTGVQQEATPGGGEPDSRHDTPEGEREFRGGR